MNDSLVTTVECARDDLVSNHYRVIAMATLRCGPRRLHMERTRYRIERLSLPSFFAAQRKKVPPRTGATPAPRGANKKPPAQANSKASSPHEQTKEIT
ncbi:hypothetical protein N0A02_12460 [Paraburkholderia acidicola]|uniref:Uncharacterized protein n=1 Tax=Paraburkholderia acidicola TaxID=1912599 RepID=A0ABV1LNC1_9BURK